MNVRWRDGFRAKVAADVAGAVIAGLPEITPAALLDAARAKNSPIHNCFEWDDSKAADSFRLRQSYKLIANLVITVEKVETRAYHMTVDVQSNSGPGTRVYASLEDAMANPETREAILRRARRDFERYRDKYRNLEELAPLFAAFEAVTE